MNSLLRDAVWNSIRKSIAGFVWMTIRDTVVDKSVKDAVWMSAMNSQVETLQNIIHDETVNYFKTNG
jgi:hypothetical protein